MFDNFHTHTSVVVWTFPESGLAVNPTIKSSRRIAQLAPCTSMMPMPWLQKSLSVFLYDSSLKCYMLQIYAITLIVCDLTYDIMC